MEWNFIESDPNGHDRKDASKQTVQSSDLSPLQVFVREVLQNSLDNHLSKSPVEISFEIRYLTGSEKINFMKTIGWSVFKHHLEASRNEMVAIRGGTMLSDPGNLENPDVPLKLLYIHDSNTQGLIGAEMPREAKAMPGPHCFVGLCRNTGDNQKGQEASGGTNGFGKTVLWKSSRIGTVLFYSRLSIPYNEHDRRFFGQTRIESYDLGDKSYRGVGFLGALDNNLSISLYDDDADSIASDLLISRRRSGAFGTSILIVDFDDPDTEDDVETPNSTAENMIRAAEEYFWPAIIDGRLTVRCGYQNNGTMDWLDAAPRNRPELTSFIKAYHAIHGIESDEFISVDPLPFTVPAGPSDSETAAEAKAFVAVKKELDESNATCYRNYTALIRGAGMVVGYVKVSRGLGGEEYSGVVVSGRACPEDKSDKEGNQRSEKLLAYSEPVTHDAWKPDSDNIRACGWRGAHAAVSKVVDGYKNIIAKRTGHTKKNEGDAAPALARLLTLNQGDAATSERDIHIHNIMGPVKTHNESGTKGIFSFKVKIPAKSDFQAKKKPDKWRVRCSYGFLGEGGRSGSKIQSLNVPVSIIKAALNGDYLEVDSSVTKEFVYVGDVTDEARVFSFRGESQYFEGLTADTSRHELLIRVDKGYGA